MEVVTFMAVLGMICVKATAKCYKLLFQLIFTHLQVYFVVFCGKSHNCQNNANKHIKRNSGYFYIFTFSKSVLTSLPYSLQ